MDDELYRVGRMLTKHRTNGFLHTKHFSRMLSSNRNRHTHQLPHSLTPFSMPVPESSDLNPAVPCPTYPPWPAKEYPLPVARHTAHADRCQWLRSASLFQCGSPSGANTWPVQPPEQCSNSDADELI